MLRLIEPFRASVVAEYANNIAAFRNHGTPKLALEFLLSVHTQIAPQRDLIDGRSDAQYAHEILI